MTIWSILIVGALAKRPTGLTNQGARQTRLLILVSPIG